LLTGTLPARLAQRPQHQRLPAAHDLAGEEGTMGWFQKSRSREPETPLIPYKQIFDQEKYWKVHHGTRDK